MLGKVVTYGQVGELVVEVGWCDLGLGLGPGRGLAVSSAAVILASVGPPSLAALLLLEKLTDVFWGHDLEGRRNVRRGLTNQMAV